ncbi:MAG: hypothetical protein H0T50_15565 [Gemmatimonadales bacterium]|nr:hypothetical protein [Gemmatimonadales bacterium]
MRVPHYAARSLLALTLAGLLAGCGKDSTAPDAPFDPAGTSSDIEGMQSSFDSPAMEGYASATASISAVLGESPAAAAVRAAPTKALVAGGKRGATAYAVTLAKAYRRPGGGGQASVSAAAIPAEYLGVTFTFNTDSGKYLPSELTGAPEDGVRFVVYAINPISGVPVEPLVEVGHADIVTTETANAITVQVLLVSGGVTYLDYSVGATGNASGLTLAVSGYVTNGDDRVNFDLDNQLSETALSIDYVLTVPTRGGFRLAIELGATETTSTADVEVRGEHGRVHLSGSTTDGAGALDVEVNGELLAIITLSPDAEPVVTGAEGQALTEDELEALRNIILVVGAGLDFFEDLIDPIG